MRVTLQLTPAAATRVRAPRTRSTRRKVLPWLSYQLQPVHPATDDPVLATFFTIEVGEASEAENLLRRLREDPSVEGAYIKPDDALA